MISAKTSTWTEASQTASLLAHLTVILTIQYGVSSPMRVQSHAISNIAVSDFQYAHI